MADIDFPSGINPLSGNYGFSRGSNVQSISASGMPRTQIGLTNEPVTIPVSISINDAEMVAMNTFYDTTLKHGSLAFNMNLDTGNGIESVEVNIATSTWSVIRTAMNRWHVNFSVVTGSTSSQTNLCTNLFDLNDCYGDETCKILQGLSDVFNALPDDCDTIIQLNRCYGNTLCETLSAIPPVLEGLPNG